MIEHPDYWELPLKELPVTYCLVDFSFGFDLEQGEYVVKIHNDFLFISGGETH